MSLKTWSKKCSEVTSESKMKAALAFFLALLFGMVLSGCDQLFARLKADAQSVAGRWNVSQIEIPQPSPNDPIPPSNDAMNETKRSATQAITAEPSLSNSTANQMNTQVRLNARSHSDSTPSTVNSISPVAPNRSTPEAVEKVSRSVGEVDIFQRANANQVNLRDGDVSFDFSKDMPVINSRNSMDLNSQ